MNEYLTLKDRHSTEFNDFPMVFAFNNKQFEKGMEKLGLSKTDKDKIYKTYGGGFYKRTDSKRLKDMMKKHTTEMEEAIKADNIGDKFIFDMFNYELSNHEYSYTGDMESTLDALGLSIEDINKNPALIKGLKLAETAQFN